MSPPPVEGSQPRKPWPGYFIVRTTGEVVPLIAIDELPRGLNLVGVPRSIGLEDTIGMINLGVDKNSRAFYEISVGAAKSTTVSQAKTTLPPPTPRIPRTTPPRQPPNSPINLRDTTLCRHWCTHGVCKWGQQCRYKHFMPMSLNGLAEVGLSDWPSWFRSLNPGFFVAGGEMIGWRQMRNKGLGAGAERRFGGKVVEREKEKESLGEQIIETLRGMEREKERGGVKGRGQVLAPKQEGKEKKSASVSVMVERAAVRDARRWEDESEDSGECESGVVNENSGSEGEAREVKREVALKGKLVDI